MEDDYWKQNGKGHCPVLSSTDVLHSRSQLEHKNFSNLQKNWMNRFKTWTGKGLLEIEACLLTQTSSKNLQEQTTETHTALTLSTRLRIHGSKKARVKSGILLSDRNITSIVSTQKDNKKWQSAFPTSYIVRILKVPLMQNHKNRGPWVLRWLWWISEGSINEKLTK